MRPAVLLVLLAATWGGEASGPTLSHVLRAVPAPGPVRADGDLADWDLSGAIVVADRQDAPTRLAQVMAMHDAAGIWLAFRYRDASPMVNHVDPRQSPGRGWCGDCVQLRIGTGQHHGEVPPGPCELLHLDAYWYGDGGRATAHAVYGDLSPGGVVHRTVAEAEGDGVTSGYRIDPDRMGYVQELHLAWRLLRPLDPRPYAAGESLRLAVEPMWGDGRFRDQPASRVTDLLDPRLPERDQLWANHRAWGRLTLLAAGRLEAVPGARSWEAWCALAKPTVPPAPATVATKPVDDRPCGGDDPTARQINAWFAQGQAAGNRDEAYDNRDRAHSQLDLALFPQLAAITYTDADRLAGRDYALFQGVRPQVVFGNSSTSGQAAEEGCNLRSAAMDPAGMHLLHAQYRAGNLYVYPAHHDYHPGHDGSGFWGDLLPVNHAYGLLSRGSSGSDQPFLAAAIRTSAAFTPAVKAALLRQGLLMPTVQALLRRTYRVADPDPCAGVRHPPVFEGTLLDEAAMVAAAHAMAVEDIPPLAEVAIIDEDALHPGTDAPAWASSERLCDTPGAAGRIYRSWRPRLRLTASARGSADHQGRPLSFRWVLLQGDPAKVRISPRDAGATADLEIAWHDRFPVQPGSAIHGNRVDIGVFASNGRAWSAPAFISVYCPDNELRTWDARGRLAEVDYAATDCTIGWDTPCLLPADGIPAYDVRDWASLLQAAAGDGPVGRLCGLDPAERSAFTALAGRISALPPPAPTGGDVHRRWNAERERSVAGSRLLLDAQPGLAVPAKQRLEGLLNSWVADPGWRLAHHAELAAAEAAAPAEVRQAIASGRERLARLGICTGDDQRADLTRGEQAEVARHQLAIVTRLLLPGIVAREARANYLDARLGTPPPARLGFAYDGDATLPARVIERK